MVTSSQLRETDSTHGRFLATGGAAALMALFLGLVAASVPLLHAGHNAVAAHAAGQFIVTMPFALVGFLVARRQPRNAMGWILLGVAVLFVVQDDASLYTVLDYRQDHGRLLLGPLAVLLQPTWAPAIVLMVLALLLFPDARLPLGGWRWMLLPFLGIAAVWMVGAFGIAAAAIADHTVTIVASGDLQQLEHPTGSAAWWGVVQTVFFPVLFASGIGSLARQVINFARSSGDRRLQLKWLLAGGVVFTFAGFLTLAFSSASSHLLRVISNVGTTGLAALPICIGIAILKYRLFDIDRVISRALSYAAITGVLIAVYVGLIALTTRALPLSSPVGVAASTLAAAALFSPLRRRVQRLIDRRFNRARYDAEQTIAAFSGRLRDEVDIERVQSDLVTVVQRAMQPVSVAVWIRTESAAS